MKHDVKIVIGANYGDEGKGLMSRYFTKQFEKANRGSVTVFHNGTAQRGHTVDYENGSRHIFHNFGAGAREGAKTFYAPSFLVHPMDFVREVKELGYVPHVFCSPQAKVVTPLDMLTDLMINEQIATITGEREYGSCCYGSWSATDRFDLMPDLYRLTVSDFARDFEGSMDIVERWFHERMEIFFIERKNINEYAQYLAKDRMDAVRAHFKADFEFFVNHAILCDFDDLWNVYDAFVFEGAQGLCLDKDFPTEWHTTSKTGLANPVEMLKDKEDFDAEVCYVTRSYLTRHGKGPLENEATREQVSFLIDVDKTNQPNECQGTLRYAQVNCLTQRDVVDGDFALVKDDSRYRMTIAQTHCNELYNLDIKEDYQSWSPTEVKLREL